MEQPPSSNHTPETIYPRWEGAAEKPPKRYAELERLDKIDTASGVKSNLLFRLEAGQCLDVVAQLKENERGTAEVFDYMSDRLGGDLKVWEQLHSDAEAEAKFRKHLGPMREQILNAEIELQKPQVHK